MTLEEWRYYFGDNLNRVLIEEKITRKEFAEQLGIDVSTVSRYINGETVPSIKHIINMTYVLACDYSDIIEFGEMID